ncbi:MAG: TIGR03013 family PEP-CTERM/XrtA system glycosyltransferase [Gammaproteobacteria bacterium]|nr:TIGR03013 family PEP-CTERM/XrtA system glycosyltransferase [Gammaproteobacteria bacterium]
MASVQVFKSHLKTPFLILLIAETCVVYGSVYSAIFIRFYSVGQDFADIAVGLLDSAVVITLITAITTLSTGLYVGRLREGMAGVLIRIAISMVMSSIMVVLIFYLFPDLFLGRGVLALVYVQSFFIIGTVRTLFFELVDTSVFKSRVLVYGAGADASYIDKKLRRKSDRRGFDIFGYALLDDQNPQVDEKRIVTIDSPLLEYVNKYSIDEIVVATSDIKSRVKIDELVDCKLNGINVLDILTFFEREAGQIRIDIMDPTWLVTSDGFNQSRLRNIIKRLFDLVASFVLLVVSFPVQVLIVIAIWAEDGIGAPVIYRQMRIGEYGSSFNVYKFRSMISNAEREGNAVWASEGDSRVTGVGSFLRKYRLDELPQAVNVIKGDMSFVGPRPERPEFISELSEHIPYYKERHVLKPGLTGWAQLNFSYGSSMEDAYHKHLYDMYYVKNHSLFLDCLIILQTVEIIIFGKGAR